MVLKRWAAGIMVLMLLVVAGCGSTAKNSEKQAGSTEKKTASSQVSDVRTLLTKAEATELMGEPIKDPDYKKDAGNPLGQQLLFFSPVEDTAVRFIQLSLVQNEGMNENMRSSGYNVTQLFEDTKKNFTEITPVSGIGEQAFFTTGGLHILSGNYYLNINAGSDNQELAKKVAAKVLPRL